MFEKERILQLHNQGHCTASICVRLAVPSAYVRQAVGYAEAVKAVQRARWLATPEGRAAVAQAKRDKALRLLAEATAELER